MARQEIVTYSVTDDIDGTPLPDGHQSTRFTYGSFDFDIDLSEENVTKLTESLEEVARKQRDLEAQIEHLRNEFRKEAMEVMRPYTSAGRRVTIVQPPAPKGRGKAKKSTRPAVVNAAEAEKRRFIRGWAQGYIPTLPAQGRLNNDIVAAYEAGRNVEMLRAYADQNQMGWREGGINAPRPVSAPPATPEPVPVAEPVAESAPADKPEAPAKGRKTPAKASA